MSKYKLQATPLMRQYEAMKKKHGDAILLFRVGDFYETFSKDALEVSKILNIVLTKRANGSAASVELAGFPYHALDNYLPKLVKAGKRVAICEQLEDPKQAKGLVKRGITEVVTPGTAMDENILDQKKNNYLCAVFFHKGEVAVSFLEVSTGDFFSHKGSIDEMQKLISNWQPSELLYSKAQKKMFLDHFGSCPSPFAIDDWFFKTEYASEIMKHKFKVNSLKGFGLSDDSPCVITSGIILHYLKSHVLHENVPIQKCYQMEHRSYVWMDTFTMDSLELLAPQRLEGVPLISILDHCKTAMGSRLLRRWLMMPLKTADKIQKRLEVVDYFYSNENILEQVQKMMQGFCDLERICAKITCRKIYPRQLKQFQESLKRIAELQSVLRTSDCTPVKAIAQQLDRCEDVVNAIEQQLTEEPPMQLQQGNVIAEGVSKELDECRKIASSGKQFLADLQQREIENTGISSLKVAFNKVFGYYLEVRNIYKSKVPEEWVRRQTLVNAERYITQELKEYEEKIMNAEERILQLEQQLFDELLTEVQVHIAKTRKNAWLVASLDCLTNFASNALKNHYTKPELIEEDTLEIVQGRHPVIEQNLPIGTPYIPNDLVLDSKSQQIILITGPNMSGKSAVLRQTALIVLMMQMGSFVPAEKVRSQVFNKIFTRVGASDNISKGESTFMIEMTETAAILNHFCSDSLILMDEIGRGTSTFDGLSIAWAVIQHINNQKNIFPKTLFATHYHELVDWSESLARVQALCVAVKEAQGKVIFLRKLEKGGIQRSFGIQVAKMAGIPKSVTQYAEKTLQTLEAKTQDNDLAGKVQAIPVEDPENTEALSPEMQTVMSSIKKLDLNGLSPIEALLKLNEYKYLLEK